MALDVKGRLIQLAAQMARREGMPSEYAEDYNFPKSVSKRTRILIIREAERACERCRLWSIAVAECADQLTTRHYIKEAGRTVQAKRPLQQRKVAIWPCESDKPCEDRGPENNCNFHGSCSAKGHTASFA